MVYVLLILTAFFWGGTFVAGRILAAQIPPLSSSFLRFFIASLALALILLVGRNMPGLPTRQQLPKLILLGFTGVFSYNIFFFTGLQQISAGRAALIIATTPLIITMMSALVYKEKLSFTKISGILISLTGALFVISNGHLSLLFTGGFGQGELAIIGCVLSWTAYTIFGRSVLIEISPLNAVFYSSVAGSMMLLFPAVYEGLPGLLFSISTESWGALAYLGIFGTALGFTWYYRGINAIGTARAAVFINMVPVFALLLSWLVLSETFKLSVIVGGFLVLGGVKLANSSGWTRKPSRQKSIDR
ncbi:MAG: DMT family transporter [Desulfocapsaceae bacterium]|jgi:drug/metabolite transporter (DMT)-like permease|nr:DMT family transporter [Desulfocapsaceae bacterium]